MRTPYTATQIRRRTYHGPGCSSPWRASLLGAMIAMGCGQTDRRGRAASLEDCPTSTATASAKITATGSAGRPNGWIELASYGGLSERHEAGFVMVEGKFYLIGGGAANHSTVNLYFQAMDKPHDKQPDIVTDVYDPEANRWLTEFMSAPPFEIHHAQPVVIGHRVYFVSSYTGLYPREESVDRVYVFDTRENSWQAESEIPEGRRRGAAGALAIGEKIYAIGGIVGGHGEHATTVAWFDEYDPATKTWRELADAPRPRDHFQAVASADGSRMVAVGGRITGAAKSEDIGFPKVPEVDIYDVAAKRWRTLPETGNSPILAGGTIAVGFADDVIVMGGEFLGADARALSDVWALNMDTLEWRKLPSLTYPRHGTGAIACGSAIYVAAGAGSAGFLPMLKSQEALLLDPDAPACVSALRADAEN